MKKALFFLFGLLALVSPAAAANQTLQIVNDANPAWNDQDVYLLFTANPASVTTANGTIISGVRDASLPIGTVSTATSSNGTTLVSSSFITRTLPLAPFPIQFLSGNNSATVGNSTIAPVFQVTSYANGTFTVNGTLLPMSTSDQFVVGAYSQQLSSFPVVGNIISPLSGRTQNIYEVTLGDNFAAGVIFVSYDNPLTYTTASPSATQAQTLFQIFEVSTANGAGTTTSDLTFIDAFGFPLQIESVFTSNSTVADRKTFYLSGNTVISDLDQIGTLTTNSTVLRLGPGQFAAASSTGNPSPFPSFSGYLQSLLSANQTQIIAGTQAFGTPNPPTVYGVTVVGGYAQTYSYYATLSSSGGGNFTYTLTPFGNNSFTGTVPPYFPQMADVTSLTVSLPAASVNSTTSSIDSLDETIYGCTLTSQSFQVNTSGNQSLVPTTFSGNYAVSSYSASNNSVISTDSSLLQLAVDQLGGSYMHFLTGNLAASGNVTAVNSGTLGAGNATIQLAQALSPAPQAGDRFEILFGVTSSANTISSFTTTQLGSTNLNYIKGNITFVTCNTLSANNTGQTVAIAAVDSVGNIILENNLNSVPTAGDTFRVTVPASEVQTQLYTNSGFSWVAADVLSALNLGYMGGVSGNSSTDWFSQFPQEFPYGLARPVPDDGFYNPWGAYFYNASDGYAFAFSDRIDPSPLLSTSPDNQALRLTILPQDQIDAPLVVGTTTNSSISLEWSPQTGVTYTVGTMPSAGNTTVSSANGTAQITGLPPGSPFEVSVIGSNGNQTSYTLPQIFSTTGATNPVPGPTFFQLQFIWAGGAVPLDYNRYNVMLDGELLQFTGDFGSATANAINVSGGNGTNLYVMDFIDTQNGNQTVMQSVLQLNLSNVTASTGNTTGSFTLNGVSYNGSTNTGPLTYPAVLGSSGAVLADGVASSSNSTTATYTIPSGNGTSTLIVAFSYQPIATKQFAPVQLPGPSPTPSPTSGLKATPLSISLGTTTVGTPSAASIITLSGTGLTANVTVTAPTGFQISTDMSANYGTKLTFAPVSGTLAPLTVYVRMSASTVGSKSGKVSVQSSGVATQSVALQGTVNPAKAAAIIPTPTSLTKFAATTPNASKSKSFTVKTTSINQNILVTAPSNFQVALNSEGFGNSLTLPSSGGVVNVRIAPNVPVGPVSGSVALQSGNSTAAVAVSGTVSPAPTPKPTPTPTPPPGVTLTFTPATLNLPSTTLGTPSAVGSFVVNGSGLGSDPVVVLGDNPNFQLALSASGPFSGNPVTLTPVSGNLVNAAVYVRTTGSAQGSFADDILGLVGALVYAYGDVNGTVGPAQQPSLTLQPSSLTGFQTAQGTPSAWQLLELKGSGLASKTLITVDAPTGFQVALKASGPWGKSVTPDSSQLPMPIYVRLSGNNSGFGPDYSFNGTIAAYAGAANASAAVSGNTLPPISLGASPTKLTTFTTTQGTSSAAQRVLFGPNAPCFYTGPISITVPAKYEVSMDGTNYTPSISYAVPSGDNGTQWVEELFIRISAQAAKGAANGAVTLNTPGLPSSNPAPVKITVSGSVK